jgi:hypothetical protein
MQVTIVISLQMSEEVNEATFSLSFKLPTHVCLCCSVVIPVSTILKIMLALGLIFFKPDSPLLTRGC